MLIPFALSAIFLCLLVCQAQINVLVEEDDPSLVFSPEKSSWGHRVNPKPGPNGSSVTDYYHSGGYICISQAGASISLTFNGSYVAYISDKHQAHGKMEVDLDGVKTTFSAYNSSEYGTPQVRLFEAHVDPNTPGHMIKLTNLENKTMGFDYLLFTAVLPSIPHCHEPSSSSPPASSSSSAPSSTSSALTPLKGFSTPVTSTSTTSIATSAPSTAASPSSSSTLTFSSSAFTPSMIKPTLPNSTPLSLSSAPLSSSSTSSLSTSTVTFSALSSTPTFSMSHSLKSTDQSETATTTPPRVSGLPTLSLASLSLQSSQTPVTSASKTHSSPAAFTTKNRPSTSLTTQYAKVPSAASVSQTPETSRLGIGTSPLTSTTRGRFSYSTDRVNSQPKHHDSPPASTTIISLSVATTLTIVAAAVLGVVCLRRRRRKAGDRDVAAANAMGEADQRLLVPASNPDADVDPVSPRLAITIPGTDLKARRSVAPTVNAFRSEAGSARSARGTAGGYQPLTNGGVIPPSYVDV